MWEYLAWNLKADLNILVLLNLWVYGNWRRQAILVCTGTSVFDQNGMDFVTEISFCKIPVVDEKNVDFSNRQGLKVS